MSRRTHAYLMLGLPAAGAALFLSGTVGGSVLLLLWPLLCMGMMLAMMWLMGGTFRRPAGHRHADGVTPAHDDVPSMTST